MTAGDLLQTLEREIASMKTALAEKQNALTVLRELAARSGNGMEQNIDPEMTLTGAVTAALQKMGPARSVEVVDFLKAHYKKDIAANSVRSILSANDEFVADSTTKKYRVVE